MEIQADSPEKRNITMVALLTIVFYLGEAQIAGDILKIGIINVTFNNKESLRIIFLLIFGWLGFRYYITSAGSYKRILHGSYVKNEEGNKGLLNIASKAWYIKGFVKRISGRNFISQNSRKVGDIDNYFLAYENLKLSVKYTVEGQQNIPNYSFERNATEQENGVNKDGSKGFKLEVKRSGAFFFLYFCITIHSILKIKHMSSFLIPWLLYWFAALLIVFN